MLANKPPHPRIFVSFLVLVLLSMLTAPRFASAEEDAGRELEELRQWRLTADRIEAEQETQTVEAFGDVLLSSGEDYLKADYAKYYHDTDWVELKGNVEARWGQDRLTANEASFDLRNQIGWLRDGLIFVSGPHLYFRGEDIQKESGETYSFREAEITACDDDPPAWSITASEGAITIDGYAKLKHTRLNILDRPVLYSPYLIIPAKTSRQSGLLFPEFGNSSRLGYYINQPIYWAINEESDATFYEYYMSERGLMQGVEYRHTHDPDTKGLWRLDWFYDRQTADNEVDEDDQFDEDGLTRSNHVRYWWRSKLNTHLPDPDWEFKLDVDYVSDQNYLREFSAGLSGYDHSRETFLDEFRRDIETMDALERTSSAVLFRSWDSYGFAARADYTQNLAHMNGNRAKDMNNSVQRLPEIAGYKYKEELFTGPLEFEMDASAANFTREHGTSGGRLDARPRLSLPIEFSGVTIIPEAGFRETVYYVDTWGGNRTISAHDDDLNSRELPEFRATAFTGFFKVYEMGESEDLSLSAGNAGNRAWTRIMHTVQPRLAYDWRPFATQAEKPEFDELDRLGPVNELTYSLTNVLDRRREVVVMSAGDDPEPRLAIDYLEFLRVRLQQSFDLREADRSEDRDIYPRRPFSDILLEATASPDKYVSLTSRTFWSPYMGDVTEHDHFLRLSWPERGHFDFGLDFVEEVDEFKRFREERLRIMRTAIEFVLSDRWSAGFLYRADLVTDTDLEKTLYAEYKHQCFAISASFTQTPYEDRIEANVSLVGINF